LSTALTIAGRDTVLEVIGAGLVELHERAAVAAAKPRWAAKLPENVLHWRDWQTLLDERWLLVHVVRNPLDTVASLREVQFMTLPLDLGGQIVHYREHLEAGGQFKAEYPDRYHLVVYEQLVAEPEQTIGGLMEALGEMYEPAQLRFNERPHQLGIEDFKVSVTDAIHDHSLHRWRELLSDAEAEMVWDLTADLWKQVDPDGSFIAVPSGC